MRDDDTHTEDQWRDHLRRLDRIRGQFADEHITAADKQRQMAAENLAYHGPGYRSRFSGESITEAPGLIAPVFVLGRREPADPAPFAARIRRALGWAR